MQLSKLTSTKIIIPAAMLAGGVAVVHLTNNNNISSDATLEYMDKNPVSQGVKAGILTLFGLRGAKRRKEDENTDLVIPANLNSNLKAWDEVKNKIISIAEDLSYEDDVYSRIDNLIKKIDEESINKEAGKFAIQGLKYLKEHENDIVTDTGEVEYNGIYLNDSNDLYWSIFHTIKFALYPDLVKEAEKEALPKWIELGNAFMNNNP